MMKCLSLRTVRACLLAGVFVAAVASSTAVAFGAVVWSGQTPAPSSTVTAARPLVSARITGTVRPLWEGVGSWYVKVDGRAVRNPVQLLDKNPDGTYDYTKATIYGTPYWNLAAGNHTAEVSCFDGARYKTSWTFGVGLPPAITDVMPVADSVVDTVTPTITANLGTGGAVASVLVTVDGVTVPSSLVGGVVSAKVTDPLEDYAVHNATIVATGPTLMSATTSWSFTVESKPRMTVQTECLDCHTGYPNEHPMTNCVACHGPASPIGGDYSDPAQYHGPGTWCGECHFHIEDCTSCHGAGYPTVPALHEFKDDAYHVSSTTSCSPCHSRRLTAEHNRPGLSCETCHASTVPAVQAAVLAGDTACPTCHVGSSGGHLTEHEGSVDVECSACHAGNLVTEHVGNRSLSCSTCHDSTNPLVSNAIALGNLACDACHPGAGSHTALHDVTLADGCAECHQPNLSTEHDARAVSCAGCHESADPNVAGAIAAGDKECASCHTSSDGHASRHDTTLAENCSDCHVANLAGEHDQRGVGCAGCHASADANVIAAIASGNKDCTACHTASDGHTGLHDSVLDPSCADCHEANLVTGHVADYGLRCADCHQSTDPAVVAAIAAGDKACTACHGSDAGNHKPLHDSTLAPECSSCHASNLVDTHDGLPCATCHQSANTDVIAAIAAGDKACTACHGADAGNHRPLHDQTLATDCSTCHQGNLADEHEAHSLDCATCHSSTDPTVTAAIAEGNKVCSACHADAGNHAPLHDVEIGSCSSCHVANLVSEHTNHSIACADCHSSTSPDVIDAIAAGDKQCSACHDFANHPYVAAAHQATVANLTIGGTLTDPAGTPFTYWDGATATYGGQKCGECHLMDLAAEHAKPTSSVSASQCNACHPSPRSTFTSWNTTCQQGGCHATYHTDMSTKHAETYGDSTAVTPVGSRPVGCGQASYDCHDGYWPRGDLAAVHAAAQRDGGSFDDLSGYPNGCKICHTSASTVPSTPASCGDCHAARHGTATYP